MNRSPFPRLSMRRNSSFIDEAMEFDYSYDDRSLNVNEVEPVTAYLTREVGKPSPYITAQCEIEHELVVSEVSEDTREKLESDHHDLNSIGIKELAKEAVKARLFSVASAQERRSAWEVAFLILTMSIALLLTAPMMIKILLAMHGIEA